jgi:hypothetical protein
VVSAAAGGAGSQHSPFPGGFGSFEQLGQVWGHDGGWALAVVGEVDDPAGCGGFADDVREVFAVG